MIGLGLGIGIGMGLGWAWDGPWDRPWDWPWDGSGDLPSEQTLQRIPLIFDVFYSFFVSGGPGELKNLWRGARAGLATRE